MPLFWGRHFSDLLHLYNFPSRRELRHKPKNWVRKQDDVWTDSTVRSRLLVSLEGQKPVSECEQANRHWPRLEKLPNLKISMKMNLNWNASGCINRCIWYYFEKRYLKNFPPSVESKCWGDPVDAPPPSSPIHYHTSGLGEVARFHKQPGERNCQKAQPSTMGVIRNPDPRQNDAHKRDEFDFSNVLS